MSIFSKEHNVDCPSFGMKGTIRCTCSHQKICMVKGEHKPSCPCSKYIMSFTLCTCQPKQGCCEKCKMPGENYCIQGNCPCCIGKDCQCHQPSQDEKCECLTWEEHQEWKKRNEDPECKHGNAKSICANCELESPSPDDWRLRFRKKFEDDRDFTTLQNNLFSIEAFISTELSKAQQEAYNRGYEEGMKDVDEARSN